MKKIFCVIILLLTISPCISKEYACIKRDEEGFTSTSITTEMLNRPASEQCARLKQCSVSFYDSCVEQHNFGISMFKEGYCKEIGVKRYNFDGANCEIKYILETNEGFGYGCRGKNPSLAKQKIESIYNRDFKTLGF